MELKGIVTVLLFICLQTSLGSSEVRHKVPIGVLIGPEDEDVLKAVKFALSEYNNVTSRVLLDPTVERFHWPDVLQIGQAVCRLLEGGVYSILAPTTPRIYNVLVAYSNAFQVPIVSTVFPETAKRTPAGYGVAIRGKTVSAAAEVMKLYKWRSFIYLYDSDEGPEKLQQLLKMATETRLVAGGLQRVSSGEEANVHLRQLLKDSPNGRKSVILATRPQLARDIITTHVHDSFLRKHDFHFLLMEPITDDSLTNEVAVPGTIYISRFRIADPSSPSFRRFSTVWKSETSSRWQGNRDRTLQENAMMMYDGVKVLHQAYDNLLLSHPSVFNGGYASPSNGTPKFDCMKDPQGRWELGFVISQFLRQGRVPDGLTGHIQFDSKGGRRDFTLDVMETTPTAHVQIGSWSDVSGMKVIREPTPLPLGDVDMKITKKLIITTYLTEPFLMRDGGDFSGYVKDLADKLAEILNFDYRLQVVKDGKYGIKSSTGEWSGMIGEVIRGEADIAMADLTITSAREKDIDFTRPFMSVATTMLMKKTDPSSGSRVKSNPFFFLSAFSYDVWISLIVAYVVISLLGYLVSRFTGHPDRIRSLDTKQSDSLSVCSSFWFSLGSLMIRGTGVYPRSLAHRLLTAIWWLFTLVVVLIFVASLTSILVVDKTTVTEPTYTRDVIKVMEHSVKTGSPQIGYVAGGSTAAFFQSASTVLYKKFAEQVRKNPQLITSSYPEGIERVLTSDNYAFIMESSAAEYTANRNCELAVVPGSLRGISYGIAVTNGSPLRELLSATLMQLEESGTLSMLYHRWWKEGATCSDLTSDSFMDLYAGYLSLADVAGVFHILVAGVVVGLITAVAEYFFKSRHLNLRKERGQPKSGAI